MQVNAGGDVAPLVAAADLQLAAEIAAEHVKIKRLEQHVAELGVADARLAVLHAGADAFLGHHLVDGKILADVAQKIEVAQVRRPSRRCPRAGRDCPAFSAVEIQQARELRADGFDVGLDLFLGEQLALGGFAAGIADAAGRAAGDGDGMMAEGLGTAAARAAAPDGPRAGCRPSDRSRSKA
jgi:hypothetical protein